MSLRRLRLPTLLSAVLLAGLAGPATGAGNPSETAAAPQKKKKKKGDGKKSEAKKADKDAEADAAGAEGFRFVSKQYPSLRFGKVARVDFRAKVQADFRGFEPARQNDEGLFDLHRARIGLEGTVFRIFEYQVEREVRDEVRELFEEVDEESRTENPWRDVYVNFRYFRQAQLQVGKFKVPFGLEQTTGTSRLDFIFRSRASDTLTPARDKGIVLHGRLFERGLGYEAGYFREDGENARNFENQGTGRRAVVARLTGEPLRLLPLPKRLQSAELGIAVMRSRVPEGTNSLRGRTYGKDTFFSRMFVAGTRLRLGTELSWTPGPFSLKGEFIHLRDQRLRQSVREEDLPDLIARGWYVSGTWLLTGEKKSGTIEPRREFLRGAGFGAVELAARYEALRFGSSEHPGRPSRGTRAANVAGNSDRAWTFGINWFLNRWLKVQGNFIHERIEDPVRRPIENVERYWMRIVRLQFEL